MPTIVTSTPTDFAFNSNDITGADRDRTMLRHVRRQHPAPGTIATGTRFRLNGRDHIVTSVGADVVRYVNLIDPDIDDVDCLLWYVTPAHTFLSCIDAGIIELAHINY